jgi:hypothetical protein
MIVVPIILVGYLIIWLLFKGLERTFTGRIIIASLVIGFGIFVAIVFQSFQIPGIIMVVLGIILLVIEILKQQKLTSSS